MLNYVCTLSVLRTIVKDCLISALCIIVSSFMKEWRIIIKKNLTLYLFFLKVIWIKVYAKHIYKSIIDQQMYSYVPS